MHPHLAQATILMVHYGDPEETARALEALWRGGQPPRRVIIIDHADEALILPARPQHVIIRPRTNSGYAAGLNIALGVLFVEKPREDEVVICMNNDVEVTAMTIARVREYFSLNIDPVLLGARWGHIHPLTGRATILPVGAPRPRTHPALTYLDGAFFASTWSVWRRLQKIPDDYFMYWEESMLGAKAREQNIQLEALPEVAIKHTDNPNAGQAAFRTYYLVRNGSHYMQTLTPLPVRWWWKIYNPARLLYHTLRRGEQSGITRRALSDMLHGVQGRINDSNKKE